MGNTQNCHRPLVGGIVIYPGRPQADNTVRTFLNPDGGTLTCMATKGTKKVLVTNQHVLSGNAFRYGPPPSDVALYQKTKQGDTLVLKPGDHVGGNADWVDVAVRGTNDADVGICDLDSALDNLEGAIYQVHRPGHATGYILKGVVEPTDGMVLKMFGAKTGESTVTVKKATIPTDMPIPVDGVNFANITELVLPSGAGVGGDSGAPVLLEVAPGRYRMCGIFFAGLGTRGLMTKASVAERELGITFGKPRPVAVIADPSIARPGDRLHLNAQDSYDPAGTELTAQLTYEWIQLGGPSVLLHSHTTYRPSFIVPAQRHVSPLSFRLTVTDVAGQTATKVVTVNRPPVANAGDDHAVLPNTVVTLDGSGSKVYDGDAKYQWEQVYAGVSTDPDPDFHRVTITNPATRKATFTMPENEQTLLFKLTVTDSYKLTSTDYVAVNLNRKPVANAGPDQQVGRGVRVDLKGSAQDPDTEQDVTHEWTKIYGPDVTLHNSDTLTPHFVAPNESAIFAQG